MAADGCCLDVCIRLQEQNSEDFAKQTLSKGWGKFIKKLLVKNDVQKYVKIRKHNML